MRPYVGRFAPSPTGALHFGSLVAAVGSYLQARHRGGRWLVRIEDLDPPRTVPGAARDILTTLERLGFQWDGPVLYQSTRTEEYHAAVELLRARSVAFECSCSRKDTLAETTGERHGVYPGTCRAGVRLPDVPTAVRIRVPREVLTVPDKLQGPVTQELESDVGDFVVRRRDGWFAYQLAVVVDDASQGITEVVRGADLLDSTPRQWFLQSLLEYSHPDYVHLPVALGADGSKLSKRHGALAISQKAPAAAVYDVLEFLCQHPPVELRNEARVEPIWTWAVNNWQLDPLRGLRTRVWGEPAFACGSDRN